MEERVSQEVFEELKELELSGISCQLQFRAANGGLLTVQTHIRHVFDDEDGQYLLGDGALTLRLHQIVAINGRPTTTIS